MLLGLCLSPNLLTDHGQFARAAQAAPAPVKQQSFATPDEALKAIVEDLKAEGFVVVVAFWSHAATELKNAANAFFDLNPYHKSLTRT